jgi:hypothetical protein
MGQNSHGVWLARIWELVQASRLDVLTFRLSSESRFGGVTYKNVARGTGSD